MAENDAGEKTEDPTAKRLQDARKDGNLAQTTELGNLLAILAIVVYLSMYGGKFFRQIAEYVRSSIGLIHYQLTMSSVPGLLSWEVSQFLRLVMPLASIMAAAGVAATLAQIGFVFTARPLSPKSEDLNKIFNPLAGLRHLFTLDSVMNLVKSVAKLALVSLIIWFTLRRELGNVMAFMDMGVADIGSHMARLAIKLMLNVFFFYIIIALADWGFTRWRWWDKLKMTKSEVKDEFRQLEGDPHVRNRVRHIMLKHSQKRMMAKVPEADVVITNPVHLAVALRYRQGEDNAPVILAKGKLLVAERIKEIARQNSIPIIENPPVARLLYKTGRIGMEIDIDLYSVVAEILAQVYRAKQKGH